MKNKLDLAFVIAFMVMVAGLFVFLSGGIRPQQAQGSVSQASEYQSTTTPNGTAAVMAINTPTAGITGTLGSVIITGTSTGAFAIYDATTTNINARTSGAATSTITIASFPAGELPGTYTFDSIYRTGLIIVFTGTIGSTTITYR